MGIVFEAAVTGWHSRVKDKQFYHEGMRKALERACRLETSVNYMSVNAEEGELLSHLAGVTLERSREGSGLVPFAIMSHILIITL